MHTERPGLQAGPQGLLLRWRDLHPRPGAPSPAAWVCAFGPGPGHWFCVCACALAGAMQEPSWRCDGSVCRGLGPVLWSCYSPVTWGKVGSGNSLGRTLNSLEGVEKLQLCSQKCGAALCTHVYVHVCVCVHAGEGGIEKKQLHEELKTVPLSWPHTDCYLADLKPE